MKAPTRILIVDDHQLVLDGLQLMLSDAEDMACVAVARHGRNALVQLQKQAIDLILLDINMPEMNGVEVCREIRKTNTTVRILALSMLREASLIKEIMQQGANGYLLKNAGQEELLPAVRQVMAGRDYLSADVAQLLSESKAQPAPSSPFPRLSRREKQVLQLIVEEFTTGEIADQLSIGFGTVETHRRNLLTKLGARNTAGLVRTALEYNLLEEKR
jgi:DNA-binding NarL/FixJ family response regulator